MDSELSAEIGMERVSKAWLLQSKMLSRPLASDGHEPFRLRQRAPVQAEEAH